MNDYNGVPQYNYLGSFGSYGQPAPMINMQAAGFSGQQPNLLSGGFGADLVQPNGGGFNLGANSFGNVGAPATAGGGSMWDNFLTKDGNQGWGGMALGAIGGMANLYLGLKQYGLAKQQLAEGKRQFELNYDAQRKLTNSQLEDRQRARVASNPGGYESVGSYMDRNGIK